MRPNIVSEAGIPTRLNQWWGGIPFVSSSIVILCGLIYLLCLLIGYDSFQEICFLPSMVISHFQVYRVYSAVIFHGSILHVMFNMLAFVPLGSGLERILGSVRFLYATFLLATTNAIFHILLASVIAHNPFHPYLDLMNECAIGFSGVIFSMIVIETSLSGAQTRSVFGLFNVPAQWYAWILLIVFQLLMTNVSLLGHLCGILSGFAYIYGMFNILLPGTSFFSRIEGSTLLSSCVRRPKFIVGGGGSPTAAQLPTYSHAPLSSISGNLWRSVSSWMPVRGASTTEEAEDSRFPGRGRRLGASHGNTAPTDSSDLDLRARLLDEEQTQNPPATTISHVSVSEPRNLVARAAGVPVVPAMNQGTDNHAEKFQKLVAMGFDKDNVEIALSAADGDTDVAIEILTSQA